MHYIEGYTLLIRIPDTTPKKTLKEFFYLKHDFSGRT